MSLAGVLEPLSRPTEHPSRRYDLAFHVETTEAFLAVISRDAPHTSICNWNVLVERNCGLMGSSEPCGSHSQTESTASACLRASSKTAQENENRCIAIVGAIFSGLGYARENFFFLGHSKI